MSAKYGFIYIWFDRKHRRFYIGSHWGAEDDGYICSSRWMRKAYKRRPEDFKRRVVKRIYTDRIDLVSEETRWLNMMKDHELTQRNTTHDDRIANVRYYNFNKKADHLWHVHEDRRLTVGEKISAAKTGKSTGPCSPEKARKIAEAKLAKAELKYPRPSKDALIADFQNRMTIKEVVQKYSATLRIVRRWMEEYEIGDVRELWIREEKPAPVPRGAKLKELWADPEWRENQRVRLTEGAQSRPPRSEESKMKARMAQLGKPKPRKKSR